MIKDFKQKSTKVDDATACSPEDLNQRNFQRWDLAVHENACQIKLHLETDVDVGTIDGWTPPQSETAIRDLG